MPGLVYGGVVSGATMQRETPCPDCGRAMVYRCEWRQEHPGLVDPVDESDWRWLCAYDREASGCGCFHSLNVERWELDRAMADVREPWAARRIPLVVPVE